jgi:hypothetical protein
MVSAVTLTALPFEASRSGRRGTAGAAVPLPLTVAELAALPPELPPVLGMPVVPSPAVLGVTGVAGTATPAVPAAAVLEVLLDVVVDVLLELDELVLDPLPLDELDETLPPAAPMDAVDAPEPRADAVPLDEAFAAPAPPAAAVVADAALGADAAVEMPPLGVAASPPAGIA